MSYAGLISFCTPVMGRLHWLKQTLPANLLNSDPQTEFVVLNYSDTEGLDEWMRGKRLDVHPRARYVRHDGETRWRPPHAKNLANSHGRGEYRVDLDCDYRIGPNLIPQLRSVLRPGRVVACAGLCGFLAFYQPDFESLGGYDERLNRGWGWIDKDFWERAGAAGNQLVTIHPAGAVTIDHGSDERLKRTGQTDLHADLEFHRTQSRQNIREGRLKANQ